MPADGSTRQTQIITNAIQVTNTNERTVPVRLWLLAELGRLLILVRDASPLPPVPVSASTDAENGRGLLLVNTISNRWNWYVLPQDGGKVVWALLERS